MCTLCTDERYCIFLDKVSGQSAGNSQWAEQGENSVGWGEGPVQHHGEI